MLQAEGKLWWDFLRTGVVLECALYLGDQCKKKRDSYI